MVHHLARTVVAMVTAVLMAAGVLSGASTAQAATPNSTGIYVVFQPIAKNNQMFWVITDAPTGTPLQVFVNGRHKATVPLRTYSTGEDYITYNRTWGLGTLQLRDGATVSKSQPMLAAVKLRPLEFRRVGPKATKLRVSVTAKRYNPATNSWVRIPKPMLQAKQGKWKTVKRISTNRHGKGRIVLKPKKAYKYRIVVNRTSVNHRTVETTMGKI